MHRSSREFPDTLSNVDTSTQTTTRLTARVIRRECRGTADLSCCDARRSPSVCYRTTATGVVPPSGELLWCGGEGLVIEFLYEVHDARGVVVVELPAGTPIL